MKTKIWSLRLVASLIKPMESSNIIQIQLVIGSYHFCVFSRFLFIFYMLTLIFIILSMEAVEIQRSMQFDI